LSLSQISWAPHVCPSPSNQPQTATAPNVDHCINRYNTSSTSSATPWREFDDLLQAEPSASPFSSGITSQWRKTALVGNAKRKRVMRRTAVSWMMFSWKLVARAVIVESRE
jgi:hypothetical protein